MLNYVARVLTRICRFYISYGINHTVTRLSYRVSRRFQSRPAPLNNFIITQSLGFLIGVQEHIKIPWPHGTSNHTINRVSSRVSRT